MVFKSIRSKILLGSFLAVVAHVGATEAPLGAPVQGDEQEQAALASLKEQVKGKIVWSTSRSNSKHDLWVMNADGTEKRAITQGDEVDWFPRISPDGKTVVFTRSKGAWVPETDAKFNQKWDIWTVSIDSGETKKVANDGTWGTWRPDGKSIVFARNEKVFQKNLESGEEVLLFDAGASVKEGTVAQEPNLSPDGKFLAVTLRGTSRETGIWNVEKKTWVKSGEGCQIDWFPSGKEIYRMNPTGNGGTAAPSEVLRFEVTEGKQKGKVGFFGPPKSAQMMDLPGRRSHEYFPKVSNTGDYLVWCATDKGHDHDIYDYEVYIWKIGEPVEKATRLTFHTANDRWPDLWIGE